MRCACGRARDSYFFGETGDQSRAHTWSSRFTVSPCSMSPLKTVTWKQAPNSNLDSEQNKERTTEKQRSIRQAFSAVGNKRLFSLIYSLSFALVMIAILLESCSELGSFFFLGRCRAFRSSGVNVWTRVSQLTHVLFAIATMRRMPKCLNQSGWRPCPDIPFPNIFWDSESDICLLSVSWNSRCCCRRGWFCGSSSCEQYKCSVVLSPIRSSPRT